MAYRMHLALGAAALLVLILGDGAQTPASAEGQRTLVCMTIDRCCYDSAEQPYRCKPYDDCKPEDRCGAGCAVGRAWCSGDDDWAGDKNADIPKKTRERKADRPKPRSYASGEPMV